MRIIPSRKFHTRKMIPSPFARYSRNEVVFFLYRNVKVDSFVSLNKYTNKSNSGWIKTSNYDMIFWGVQYSTLISACKSASATSLTHVAWSFYFVLCAWNSIYFVFAHYYISSKFHSIYFMACTTWSNIFIIDSIGPIQIALSAQKLVRFQPQKWLNLRGMDIHNSDIQRLPQELLHQPVVPRIIEISIFDNINWFLLI